MFIITENMCHVLCNFGFVEWSGFSEYKRNNSSVVDVLWCAGMLNQQKAALVTAGKMFVITLQEHPTGLMLAKVSQIADWGFTVVVCEKIHLDS